jgi:two-component system, LuxR family, sensor kinase FixL
MLFRRKAASANRPIKRRAAFVARLLPPNPEAEAIAHQLAKALATIQVEVEHRRRLEAKLLTAVEEERQRLGRHLHDELSQRLAATALMTHTLAKEAKGRSELDREKIRTIGNMLSEAVGVTRNLTRGLHPLTLTKQGLPAALAELAERVPKDVQFSWPRSKRLKLDQSVALHVYRIAEEALGNAIKHSGATKITIELQMLSAQSCSYHR